jgi:RND family efflux transporter MFP subunit
VVIANRTADVPAVQTGTLRRYRVRLGDPVVAGQTIASLDRAPVEKDLAMAEASLRAARAEEARATIELDQARQILERRRAVAWALSKEDMEGLSAKEALARANAEIATAHSAEQDAHVQKLRDELAKCEIRAPFSGRIGLLHQSEGMLVTPGTPVARLVADTDLWIRFAVPPAEASWATAGGNAEVLLEESGARAHARVEHVAPEVDAASGMIFVEARLETASGRARVRPGMVVRVRPLAGD